MNKKFITKLLAVPVLFLTTICVHASSDTSVTKSVNWPEGFQPKPAKSKALAEKYQKRSEILEARQKLTSLNGIIKGKNKFKVEVIGQPENVTRTNKQQESTLSQSEDVNNFAASALAKTAPASPSLASLRAGGWYYQNESFDFDNYDYVNYMNEFVYTFYADDIYADGMQVDFSFIDMESSWDSVQIWDQYGLCASYSGSYGSFTSVTCSGNYVKIFVHTDGSNSGLRYNSFYDIWEPDYDGFHITGVRYYIEPPNVPPVAVARASKYTAQEDTDVIYFDAYDSFDVDTDEPLDYYWTFGDGFTSYSENPSHIYINPGTYYVTLTVTDQDGGTDTDSFTIYVTEKPPSAEFNLNAYTVHNIYPVYLHPFADNADSIFIDWGDGSTTTQSHYSPPSLGYSHKYILDGTYTIVVKTTNTGGTSTHHKQVVITGEPQEPVFGLYSKTADGTSYTLNTTYAIQEDGYLKKMQIIYGGDPLINPIKNLTSATLDSFFSYGVYSVNQSYTFNRLAGKSTKPVAGEYVIQASVTDNDDLVSSMSFSFQTLNKAPTINVTGFRSSCKSLSCSVRFGTKDKPMTYYVRDSDGTVKQTLWRFFDSNGKLHAKCPIVKNQGSAKCVFAKPGTYTAQFKAIDNLGLYNVFRKKLVVTNAAPYILPFALSTKCTGLSCNFRIGTKTFPFETAVRDSDGTIESYDWSVYNSKKTQTIAGCELSADKAKSYTCKLPKKGTYYVRFRAKDNYGQPGYLWSAFVVK